MDQGTKLVISPAGKVAIMFTSVAVGALIIHVLETEGGAQAVANGARRVIASDVTKQLAHQFLDGLFEKAAESLG